MGLEILWDKSKRKQNVPKQGIQKNNVQKKKSLLTQILTNNLNFFYKTI